MRSVVCKGVHFPKIPTPKAPLSSLSSYPNCNKSQFQFQFRQESFLRQTLKLTHLSSSIGAVASRGKFFLRNRMAGVTDRKPTLHVLTAGVSGDAVRFLLSPTTSLVIQKGDITKWSIDGASDAIVNPANERMLGGGGADGAIHGAAGPELVEACYKVPEVRPGVRCPTGDAKITPGFKLPASHVIHTVGPIYNLDGNPQGSLKNAYMNSLTVAKENDIKYIAFPAISCGAYGYPYDEAASVAISTVKKDDDIVDNHFNMAFHVFWSVEHVIKCMAICVFSVPCIQWVHFVLFLEDIYSVWLQKARDSLQK